MASTLVRQEVNAAPGLATPQQPNYVAGLTVSTHALVEVSVVQECAKVQQGNVVARLGRHAHKTRTAVEISVIPQQDNVA